MRWTGIPKSSRTQTGSDNPKSISNNYVFSFCEDSNNNFWIGTGGGLNIFDRNSGNIFSFSLKATVCLTVSCRS
ncbi:MAG: hypothetical protein IPL53_04815 [Ignavibacteria bacterium]|nr:hypothetical protein [Ignavibacteria bacterium]